LSSFTVLSSVLLGVAVFAHHGFAEFDAAELVKLQGKVVRMHWTNPHSMIHLEVDEPSELAGSWRIEGSAPKELYRRGFTKSSLETGAVVLVEGYQAKDGRKIAAGHLVTFADGRKLLLGP
jgi:hypothetical protein